MESDPTSITVCQSHTEDGEIVAVDTFNDDLMRSGAAEQEQERFDEGLDGICEAYGVDRFVLGAESGSESSDEYVDIEETVDAAVENLDTVTKKKVDDVSSAAPGDNVGHVCNVDDVQTAKRDPLGVSVSSEPTVTSESSEGGYVTAEAPHTVGEGNVKIVNLGDAGDGDDDADVCFGKREEEEQEVGGGELAEEEEEIQVVSSEVKGEEEGTADDRAVVTAGDTVEKMMGITSGKTGDQVGEMMGDKDQVSTIAYNHQGSNTKDTECSSLGDEAVIETVTFESQVITDTEKEKVDAVESFKEKGSAGKDQEICDSCSVVFALPSESPELSPVVECPLHTESAPMTEEAKTAQIYPTPADSEGESREDVMEGNGHLGQVSEKALDDSPSTPEEEVDPHSSIWERDPSECPLPSSSDESAFDSSFRLEKQREPALLEMPLSSGASRLPVLIPGEPDDQPAGISSPRLPPFQDPFILEDPGGDGDRPATVLFAEPSSDSLALPGSKAQDAGDAESTPEEDSDRQAPESESLSASASGDLLDAQLTADDMEMVAAQLESMAILEMQKHEDEEVEEHREELTRMIDDYGNSIEPEGNESACNRIHTDASEEEVEQEVIPHSLASEDTETPGSRSDDDTSRNQEKIVVPHNVTEENAEGLLERTDHDSGGEERVISPQSVTSEDIESPLEKSDHDSGREEKVDIPLSVMKEDIESSVARSDHDSSLEEKIATPLEVMAEDIESPVERSDHDSSSKEEMTISPHSVTFERSDNDSGRVKVVSLHSMTSKDITAPLERSDHDTSREEKVVSPLSVMSEDIKSQLESSDGNSSGEEGKDVSSHSLIAENIETSLDRLDHDIREEEKIVTPHRVVEESIEGPLERSDHDSSREEEKVVIPHSVMEENTECPLERSEHDSSREEEKVVIPHSVVEENTECPLERSDHDSSREEEKVVVPHSVVEENTECPLERSDHDSSREEEKVVISHSMVERNTESPLSGSDYDSSREEEKVVISHSVVEGNTESHYDSSREEKVAIPCSVVKEDIEAPQERSDSDNRREGEMVVSPNSVVEEGTESPLSGSDHDSRGEENIATPHSVVEETIEGPLERLDHESSIEEKVVIPHIVTSEDIETLRERSDHDIGREEKVATPHSVVEENTEGLLERSDHDRSEEEKKAVIPRSVMSEDTETPLERSDQDSCREEKEATV